MATIALQLWDSPDLRVPLASRGDGLGVLASFKGVHDWGWIWTNPSLGAPLGLDFYDYGSYGAENLHWALAWVISRVWQQPGSVYNGIFLLTFPASAVAAYGVLRALRISRLAAIVPAVLFAIAPYHILRGAAGHLMLADTVAIPLGIYLALAIMLDLPLFRRRTSNDGPRLLRWVSWTSVRTALLIVVIASTGIYYACFTIVFVLVAAVAARLTHRGPEGTVVVAHRHGGARGHRHRAGLQPGADGALPTRARQNPHVGQREPQREHGLRAEPHRPDPAAAHASLRPVRGLVPGTGTTRTSAARARLRGGTLSVLGLLLLTASLLAGMVGGRMPRLLADARLRAAAVIMVTAAFLGATGAGGALIAFVLNPSLRGWNRIGIALTFCGLIAVALGLDALRARWRERGLPLQTQVFAGLVGALLVFGAWDQTWPGMKPPYKQTRAEWSNDARFVAAISHTLGARGEIYQMPYLPFPESPPILAMTDYSPLKGYVHADEHLKWSYGAMKGRPADWQGDASQMPVEDQLRAVALAGFDGLWVDNYGFADPDAQILKPAIGLTGQQPILSEDRRLGFFDLRPLRARLRRQTSTADARAVGVGLTHPVETTYGAGFYDEVHDATGTRRWAQNRAQITLENPLRTQRAVTFVARLFSSRAIARHVRARRPPPGDRPNHGA